MNINKTPSREAKRIAAESTYKEMAAWGVFPDGKEEETIDLLVKHGAGHMNGYDLAKELEQNYWSVTPNAEIVEALDGFSSSLSHARDAELKAWIEKENIKPPLEVGTRVVWQSYNGKESGVISDIYEHSPARYLIKVDGDLEADTSRNSRRVVWWDNVEKEKS